MPALTNNWAFGAILLLALAGCDFLEDPKDSVAETEAIVARVGASVITAQELELAMARLPSGVQFNADVREKVLDSLIKSRAMAIAAENQLSPEELRQLELRVQAFREELLVKSYIDTSAEPEPVSNAMVKEYYQSAPEQFGSAVVKRFEYVTTYRELEAGELERVSGWFAQIKARDGWAQLTESAKLESLPVKYQTAEMRPALLQEPLKSAVHNAAPGSAPMLIGGNQPYLVRVLEERRTPPRPLAEVSADIRKTLAPVQLKKAIQQLSERAMKNLDVERPIGAANYISDI